MKLILSDGSEFSGNPFGYKTPISGELIFNTGMTGYPETMTDPSYFGQILVFTYPLIGNYGIPPNSADKWSLARFFESDAIHLKGIVVSTLSTNYSHHNAVESLNDWMVRKKIPGLGDVDTRALTLKIRDSGSMPAKIGDASDHLPFYNPNEHNVIKNVSVKEPIEYAAGKKKVLLVDTGVKYNILRSLLQRNISVLRVPWNYDYSNETYDGIVLSNGPGDPVTVPETVENVKTALAGTKPIFGICLGHQILAMAVGAKTYKLKFGHHSQNQPCLLVGGKRCMVTSQNHNFAVDEHTLPQDWEPWFFNANDGSNEGIRHRDKPFFSVQFHPEASPGPTDTNYLFDDFAALL